MQHIPLKNRNQYTFSSLEDLIEKDNKRYSGKTYAPKNTEDKI